ncbi:Lrp/AsnC ligand binding domain-containing protein [Candidatus Bathyarchaeota archaeon]|nr:Lrp/AsnC ligand binding domain-containing protein [Candidatus Bathyarchaeota archaeon]
MTVCAFAHIQVKMGKANEVIEAIKAVNGVKEAHIVTGEFDIIAKIEADDLKSLGDKVLKNIHTIKGVYRTVTSMIVT